MASNLVPRALFEPAAAAGSGNPLKRRRLEEVLDLDLFVDGYDGVLSTKRYRPDTVRALKLFADLRGGDPGRDTALMYTRLGSQLLETVAPTPVRFAPLDLPAFGTDPTEEVPLVGKFDLIANTLTSLYDRDSPPLEHNCLLFQFMGLSRNCYARGVDQPGQDVLGMVIESQVYGGEREMVLDSGAHKSCKEIQTDVRLLKSVDDAFSLHLGDTSVDPVSTLVPFALLQRHIAESNEILRTQYSVELHGMSYTRLKEKVIEHHGPNSVVALMVHMDSPELFYDTFVPRGICSSTCTGKTTPHCNGSAYSGTVTLQVSGLLDVDVEDGDKHMSLGTCMDTAFLYLVVEMKTLVPGDCKFNYPWIRLLLSSRTIDGIQEDIAVSSKGRCHPARDGTLSTTIIRPIAKLRVGPHCVTDAFSRDSQQMSQFDLVMSSNMRHCRFVHFQGKKNH